MNCNSGQYIVFWLPVKTNTMKKRFVFFLLISVASFAQIKFENGYFIANNGVKTDCLIRNFAWESNPTEIEYKLAPDGRSASTSIAEIKEFEVGNSYKYKRFSVNIDRSSDDVAYLSTIRNPEFRKETLFLKLLVEGEVNLYQYEETNFIRYFISTGDHEKAEQLIRKEYAPQHSAISENNYFRQQLALTLQSDQLTDKDFATVKYRKTELVGLIHKYNQSKNGNVTNFETKQNQNTVNLKVAAGINASKLSFNDLNTTGYTFDTQMVFKFGFEVETVLPFNQRKWSLFAEPNLQSYSASGQTKYNQLVEAKYKFIELPVGARHYFFLNDHSKIFVNAGFLMAFSSKSFLRYSGLVLNTRKSSAYFLGAGYNYKRYSAEIRCAFPRELVEHINWESNYSAIGITLSYEFLKF